jgi:RNA polymerase sigma factor (sigma-70 family)
MDWFEVMRRFESGDHEAFAQLCALIHGHLRRMRSRRQLNQEDDIAQDALICLMRAWRAGRIREVRSFPGFVWRLTARRLSDTCARHARPGTPDSVGNSEHLIDVRAASLAGDRWDHVLDLTRMLEKLGETERLALHAIYVDGLTYVEASEWLGLPLGTFKRKLGDGLRKIRQEFN